MRLPLVPTYRMTRRDLRLASGSVLFAYVTVHLANHALGLVSVNVAEAGLRVTVALWHSVAGTALLYGAAAIHFALAMVAIFERRTFRMPPLEALRMAFGFGIPLLLIGHLASTRFAFELYGLDSDYARIVWTLSTSDGGGRQLALLAPGWLHGCLGLDFALGSRPLYRRVRPLLVGVALILPILAALGFMAMGRELVVLGANAAWLEAHVPPMSSVQQARLAHIRDGLLVAYFGTIGLILAARVVRGLLEQNRNALITIRYPGRAVRVPRGWTVLEASRHFGIAHRAMCGGRARCSTCRVRIVGDASSPPPGPDERSTLQRVHASADVRLACQWRPETDIAVTPLFSARRAASPRRMARKLRRYDLDDINAGQAAPAGRAHRSQRQPE